MFFLAIGLLVVSIVLYLLTGEAGMIAGLPRDDFMRLAAGLSLLIFLMSGLARFAAGKTARALKALGIWAAIGIVLMGVYAYRAELGEAGDRVVQELRPGSVRTVSHGTRGRRVIVRLRKTRGHFIARARVNGRRVHMIVDTGASTVVLRARDARRAGIRIRRLRYTVPVQTANGRAFAARVKLDKISLGALTLEKVDALVTRPGTLHRSLLGMSFLSRLHSYEFTGNQLVMRS